MKTTLVGLARPYALTITFVMCGLLELIITKGLSAYDNNNSTIINLSLLGYTSICVGLGYGVCKLEYAIAKRLREGE